MNNIIYTYDGSVYLNLTNKCPCNCEFCLRNNGDSIGGGDPLWLDSEPTECEALAAVNSYDFAGVSSVTVCGYGEPTCAIDVLVPVCRRLNELGLTVRLNTNGLSDLINGRSTAPELCEVIDTFSISLNAPTAEKYDAIVHSQFGQASFEVMLSFAKECRELGRKVVLTVVDTIGADDIDACRAVAQSIGVPLRVREYID